MQEILEQVTPTAEERQSISKTIKEFSKKVKIKGAKIEVGGSIAKDTWLRGEHDLDIYVKFGKQHQNKDISAILKKALEKKYKITSVHGSRTYYRIDEKGYAMEVIPILSIAKVSQAKNITDVSPFHVKFVNKHKKLTGEIRLAKALCKANNLYGAESYIKGFSGYVLEILIIHYGSFIKLLKAATKWKTTEVLDPKKYYKKADVLFNLNRSKLTSPLILVDPVQSDRNAAAGLGKDKYDKLIHLAKDYLKMPSAGFFRKKEADIGQLKKIALVIEATATRGKRDITGARLMKIFEFISRKLADNNFKAKEADWQWAPGKEAVMWFILEKPELPKIKKHYGPPLRLPESVAKFREAWKGHKIIMEGDKCYAMIERDYTDAKSLVKALLKDSYLKGKANSIKVA